MANTIYNPPGPVGARFVRSDAFVCGIRGPIGSGKSTACVMKLVRNLQKQKPGSDGIKRRRTAIIRNTYPELKTTTIKTWHQWIPQTMGKWTDSGPPTHRIITGGPNLYSDGRLQLAGITDWEVMFIALDRPEDVRKLLSMELSDAWINEAREVPKAILDGLTGRVGRFPPVSLGGASDPQIILDTNPPDTDHWWAKMADFPDFETDQANREIEEKLRAIGSLRPDQPLYKWFTQPGGMEPPVYNQDGHQIGGAENLDHLEPGYYLKASAGKSPEWIKVYVNGEYGFVLDGRPVFPEFRDGVHVAAFELNQNLPIYVGIDFGLTPAAVIGQRTMAGIWKWHGELCAEDMGARRFGEELRRLLQDRYRDLQIAAITGDPAGEARAQTDEFTPFQILRAVGVDARPAPTNDFTKRREAVAFYLNRMIDGQAAFQVHPDCQRLRKAMAGGYQYRRKQIAGSEMYHDQPDKNAFSHVADALQYAMLGAGEARAIVHRDPQAFPRNGNNRPRFAIMD